MVEAVTERVFGSAVQGMDVIVAAIGDRLGYYRALDAEPLSAERLAALTGTSPRYTREWLEHQLVAGYVEPSDPQDSGATSYRLCPGVGEVLARPGLLTCLAPLTRQVAAAAAQWARVVDGARTGTGLGWAAYGTDMREAQSDLNAAQLLELLPDTWLPAALPDLHRKMAAGEPVRVAEIGCGGGWAAISLARRFDGVRVDGYDLDPATVELARANVAAAGLSDRVRILRQDVASGGPDHAYHLVMAFECLHDLPHPVSVLAGARRLLDDGGEVLIADMAGAEQLVADDDPVQRALYGFSLLVCLPDAMTGNPENATGTVLRPDTMRRYALQAGFADAVVLPVEHDFWRFYRLTPAPGGPPAES